MNMNTMLVERPPRLGWLIRKSKIAIAHVAEKDMRLWHLSLSPLSDPQTLPMIHHFIAQPYPAPEIIVRPLEILRNSS